MARTGGFGTSTTPFGSGSLGDLGAYNIGQSLADLAVYEAEIGWGNGTVSDADYLAALQKAVDMTDPLSHARVSAVNKQQDAQYQIGREKASLAGLDQVIAFDQSSLASMNADNLKYRSVQQNLASELAQRRSRDYGKLVTDYNNGHGSTESLLAYVKHIVATIPPDAPDVANWTSVQGDLANRIQTEADAKVYQDYQHNRIKGPAFLAYVKSRRDQFDPASPDYADWTRKLEDATKSVVDTAQAVKDQAFFDAYGNGKKSDKQYLAYLSARISSMDSNDPSLPQWKQRLTQAAHSIAEDELRFAVQTGKKPVSALISFYQHYRATLNPGSPEYRNVTRAILSLSSGSGGGGGGGSGTGKVTTGGDAAAGMVGIGGGKTSPASTTKNPAPGVTSVSFTPDKVISPVYTLDSVLQLMTVNPVLPQLPKNATKAQKAAYKQAVRNQKAAMDLFALNHTSLQNAVQRGDPTWAFYDPRKPAGSKPTMLPTSGTALSNMDMLEAQFQSGLAQVALANHDAQGYYKALTKASNAQDSARIHYGQAVIADDRPLFKQAQTAIDLAMATGDWATALNVANDLQSKVKSDLALPGLDDTRRAELQSMLDKLANNDLLPTVDGNGNLVQRGGDIASATTTVDPTTGRTVFTNVDLAPGYHLVLDNKPLGADGTPPWSISFDGMQDGSWEQKHITIQTSYGDRVVTGDVAIGQAKVDPNVLIAGAGSLLVDKPPAGLVQSITYTDQSGTVVTAYSSDGGATWVKPESGQTLPTLVIDAGALQQQDNADGTTDYYAAGDTPGAPGIHPVYTTGADGSVKIDPNYTQAHPEQVQFLNVARAIADLPKLKAYTGLSKATQTQGSLSNPNGQRNLEKIQTDKSVAYTGGGAIDPHTGRLSYAVGADGQQMTVIQAGPDGTVNLTSAHFGTLAEQYAALQTQRSLAADERPRSTAPTYTLPTLPPNTPDRYDGSGLTISGTLGPVVNIPALNPITMPGITPVRKSTAPPPLKLTKATLSNPDAQRNLDLLTPDKPKALSKPPPVAKPVARANTNPTRL